MQKPSFLDLRDKYNDLEKYATLDDLARHYRVTKRRVQDWVSAARKEHKGFIDRNQHRLSAFRQINENLEIQRLKQEIGLLGRDLKRAREKALTSNELTSMIHEIRGMKFDKRPLWLQKRSTKTLHGIPTLFISDVHFDEYVDPAQINFVNRYDHDIGTRRIRHTFEAGVKILKDYIAKPKYEGIVIAFGGDLLSGNIHEELQRTNEAPILKSIFDIVQLFANGIRLYANSFGRVYIPCVVGNHGRLWKKPVAKNRVFDNYEWLIYQFLAKEFASDDRVTFEIPDGPDCVFKIFGRTFLLTHGDQFMGGNGISGIMTPLHLGLHKKQKKQAAIHRPFDVMILGHFHQYIHTNAMVVNGSIKGYDEFANLCNFPFEPPQQALWVNHPTMGMVMRTPILCDSSPDMSRRQVDALKK